MRLASGTGSSGLLRLLPSGEAIDLSASDARSTLLDWYRLDSPKHVRLTLVSTLDGRAAGSDGTSESLTSRVDRTVLGVIRELCDAVLVGAETLRREPLLVPRRRPLVVVSASGRLGSAFVPSTAQPTIVVTGHAGAKRLAAEHPTVEAVVLPTNSAGTVAMASVIDALHTRGLHRIAAEGGPHLAGTLLEAGLVDELCLTIMPVLGGTAIPLLASSADGPGRGATPVLSQLRLTRLLADDAGAVYGRWSTR